MRKGVFVVSVVNQQRRQVLEVSARRANLHGLGWVSLNPCTGVPVGYYLEVA